MQGQAFDMNISYAGKKIGSCAASENAVTKAKAQAAQMQAQVGQSCKQMADSMTWQLADQMAGQLPNPEGGPVQEGQGRFHAPGQ